jgi:hypothetical protein
MKSGADFKRSTEALVMRIAALEGWLDGRRDTARRALLERPYENATLGSHNALGLARSFSSFAVMLACIDFSDAEEITAACDAIAGRELTSIDDLEEIVDDHADDEALASVLLRSMHGVAYHCYLASGSRRVRGADRARRRPSGALATPAQRTRAAGARQSACGGAA